MTHNIHVIKNGHNHSRNTIDCGMYKGNTNQQDHFFSENDFYQNLFTQYQKPSKSWAFKFQIRQTNKRALKELRSLPDEQTVLFTAKVIVEFVKQFCNQIKMKWPGGSMEIYVNEVFIPADHWLDSSRCHRAAVWMHQSNSSPHHQLWNSVEIQLCTIKIHGQLSVLVLIMINI